RPPAAGADPRDLEAIRAAVVAGDRGARRGRSRPFPDARRDQALRARLCRKDPAGRQRMGVLGRLARDPLAGQRAALHRALRRGPVRYEVEHLRYSDLDTWLRDLVRDRMQDRLATVRSLGSTVEQAAAPRA